MNNAAKVYLDSLDNEKTKKAMRDGLYSCLMALSENGVTPDSIFAADWNKLTQAAVNTIRERLIQEYSASTVNLRLAALRGVWQTCWRMGLITKETYERLQIADFKVTGEQVGRMITPEEFKTLIAECRFMGIEGIRNAAIFAVAYQCGLRREEISLLLFENYDPLTGKINLVGKGNKARNVYVSGNCKVILDKYIEHREKVKPELGKVNYLFLSMDAHGKLRNRRLGIQGLHEMLKKVIELSGVDDFTWHDFRRTFISTLLDKGVDLAQVSQVAGHSHVEQTKRYDRRPERMKKEVFSLIDI